MIILSVQMKGINQDKMKGNNQDKMIGNNQDKMIGNNQEKCRNNQEKNIVLIIIKGINQDKGNKIIKMIKKMIIIGTYNNILKLL